MSYTFITLIQRDSLLLSYRFFQLWLSLSLRHEDRWGRKWCALNGLKLSASQSDQYTSKKRGCAVRCGWTGPRATLEGFQIRKFLTLAGNWTKDFSVLLLVCPDTELSPPPPSAQFRQRHRVERFLNASDLRSSQRYCWRLHTFKGHFEVGQVVTGEWKLGRSFIFGVLQPEL